MCIKAAECNRPRYKAKKHHIDYDPRRGDGENQVVDARRAGISERQGAASPPRSQLVHQYVAVMTGKSVLLYSSNEIALQYI